MGVWSLGPVTDSFTVLHQKVNNLTMADGLPIINQNGKQEKSASMNPTSPLESTEAGSYFVSNYPPFSLWKNSNIPQVHEVLNRPPQTDTPLGLYLHLPFCRKQCKFCYFRVYTDKNARDVEAYVKALTKEVQLYSSLPAIASRQFQFIYFGGGTPSFLSSRQLRFLVEQLQLHIRWDDTEEFTFECEPGTLTLDKLKTLKSIGVTRLSLGIENFNDEILSENGRAHLSAEILRSYEWARQVGFNQINIDLIAGMVKETWKNWKSCTQQAIALDADSVTIYQMELPFNTVFSQHMKQKGSASPVANWETKRAWVNYAFKELEKVGYQVSSAYTLTKKSNCNRFVYRDSLWHGADMIGTGVASFSHLGGVHCQNQDSFESYLECLTKKKLPLSRAFKATSRQLLIREMILQMKLGRLDVAYFRKKFGAEILSEFEEAYQALKEQGLVTLSGNEIRLKRTGLLKIDEILPRFFEPEHREARYT